MSPWIEVDMKDKASTDQAVASGGEAGKVAFRKALLGWFDEHRRELPWRGVDDPYAVWVSEVMLQQTQVATVVDYFERWMERFPTVEELAVAPTEEVLELWSGLGYYRRARYLHRGAKRVVDDYGGQVPDRVEALRELPGIGPYTAGAIASIAYGRVEPLVDGNVMRVVTRLEGIEGDPRRGEAKKRIWQLARQWVDPQRPGDFNQGLMELGSEVCTSRAPRCEDCPVRRWCRARIQGDPQRYPTGSRKTKQRPMRARCCVVFRQVEGEQKFLLRRRSDDGLLGGLWEFPCCEREGKTWPTVDTLTRRLRDVFADGEEISPGRAMGTVTHVFSHRKLKLRVHEWKVDTKEEDKLGSRWCWVGASELEDVASSALLQKVFRLWADHR